jgi:hypothetical protein
VAVSQPPGSSHSTHPSFHLPFGVTNLLVLPTYWYYQLVGITCLLVLLALPTWYFPTGYLSSESIGKTFRIESFAPPSDAIIPTSPPHLSFHKFDSQEKIQVKLEMA